MIEGMQAAFLLLFQHGNIIWILLGTFFGLIYGVLPGLGGVAALTLLLPFTFGMGTNSAIFLFAGVMGAVPFGGSISAILINTPGTPTNAATCLDGYPMTQRGEAGKALGISATSSALGAVVGIIILIILMPVLRFIVLLFGPPEFLMLILFGLASIIVASKGNMVKGLLSGAIGIMLSFVGASLITGMPRYAFETNYLWDGIKIIPLMIGLFAISEILTLASKGSESIVDLNVGKISTGSQVFKGVAAVFENLGVFFRGSAIGTLIGLIPGVGGAAANFISYSTALQVSKNPQEFGKGSVEGVIAAESANNAKDGGALIPTVAFGIPGSAEMAVLLGAFILHGLVPGPALLKDHVEIVWIIIIALVLSNLLAAVIGLFFARYLCKIALTPVYYIIPVVAVLCYVGVFVMHRSIFDVVVAVIFGFVGFGLRRHGYSVITLTIGFILGRLAEVSFHQSLMMGYNNYLIFFQRPLSLALFCFFVIILIFPIVRKFVSSNKVPAQKEIRQSGSE